MRAWVSLDTGGPTKLEMVELPKPEPQPHEVLIRVRSAGLNRVDLLQSLGKYTLPPNLSPILGIEVSGIVEACGEHVHDLVPGDRVMGLCSAGGYAEYVTLPAAHALKIPGNLGFELAAAIPEAAATLGLNLFEQADIQPHESILIHGGSGGIGTFGIQLCKALSHKVYATAGSEEKVERLKSLGAVAFNYKDPDVYNKLMEASQGIDVILDVAGGKTSSENLRLLKTDGRLQQIGYLQGKQSEIDWDVIMQKGLTIRGSRLRFASSTVKDRIFIGIHQKVIPLLEKQKIVPILNQVFSFGLGHKALKELALGQHFGKIVLSFDR